MKSAGLPHFGPGEYTFLTKPTLATGRLEFDRLGAFIRLLTKTSVSLGNVGSSVLGV